MLYYSERVCYVVVVVVFVVVVVVFVLQLSREDQGFKLRLGCEVSGALRNFRLDSSVFAKLPRIVIRDRTTFGIQDNNTSYSEPPRRHCYILTVSSRLVVVAFICANLVLIFIRRNSVKRCVRDSGEFGSQW